MNKCFLDNASVDQNLLQTKTNLYRLKFENGSGNSLRKTINKSKSLSPAIPKSIINPKLIHKPNYIKVPSRGPSPLRNPNAKTPPLPTTGQKAGLPRINKDKNATPSQKEKFNQIEMIKARQRQHKIINGSFHLGLVNNSKDTLFDEILSKSIGK
jgi:hypothetical protein